MIAKIKPVITISIPNAWQDCLGIKKKMDAINKPKRRNIGCIAAVCKPFEDIILLTFCDMPTNNKPSNAPVAPKIAAKKVPQSSIITYN